MTYLRERMQADMQLRGIGKDPVGIFARRAPAR